MKKTKKKKQMSVFFFYYCLSALVTYTCALQSDVERAASIPSNISICDQGSPSSSHGCIITTPQTIYCNLLKVRPALSQNSNQNLNWDVCSPDTIDIMGALTFEGNGSLNCESYKPAAKQKWEYQETVCTHSSSRKVPLLCEIKLNVAKSFKMKANTAINSDSMIINVTGSFDMDPSAVLNVSSRGIPSLPQKPLGGRCNPPGQPVGPSSHSEYNSYGASHAGSGGVGGQISGDQYTLTTPPVAYTALVGGNSKGNIIGNVSYFHFNSSDVEWGYSGASGVSPKNNVEIPAGRGGGRIKVMAASMILNGDIWAKGGDARVDQASQPCCGAGSGGTILLSSGKISGKGRVSASGGNGTIVTSTNGNSYLRGSGGGGRILLNLTENQQGTSSLTLDAYGGRVPDPSQKKQQKQKQQQKGRQLSLDPTVLKYGQGAPGTIVNNVVNYSAELDVWGPPASDKSSTPNNMLAITPVIINSQERVSVFNIGRGTLLYANVVSNQIRMCDTEQYCSIQRSSQSLAGLSVNTLGNLQFKTFAAASNQMMIDDNDHKEAFLYTLQTHALIINGCLEYVDTTIMDIQLGENGYKVNSPGRFSFKAGVVRITSHGDIDVSGDMGNTLSCFSSSLDDVVLNRKRRRRRL